MMNTILLHMSSRFYTFEKKKVLCFVLSLLSGEYFLGVIFLQTLTVVLSICTLMTHHNAVPVPKFVKDLILIHIASLVFMTSAVNQVLKSVKDSAAAAPSTSVPVSAADVCTYLLYNYNYQLFFLLCLVYH